MPFTSYLILLTERGSRNIKSNFQKGLFDSVLYRFFKGLLSLFVAIIEYMAKSKKYTVLGGVKVSSKQLSEWGSRGGRPKKYNSNAERQRAYKLRKKRAKFGKGTQLELRKSYETVKIEKFIACPSCNKINWDLKQYFNEEGEYIPEAYWFDTARMEKRNIRENVYHCFNCYRGFSFLKGEIEAKENRTVIKRAGSSAERSRRSREEQQK